MARDRPDRALAPIEIGSIRRRRSWYKTPASRVGKHDSKPPPSSCLVSPPGWRPVDLPEAMKPGFYTIMAAQFFSSLADNALLVAAIALLLQLAGPAWMVPMLKFVFVISYVLLAAWVGAFADS